MEEYKTFVKNFIQKYLNNDINNLANFNMQILKNDAIFGCPNRNFDGDDTEITKTIFYLIYKNILPELTYEEIGTGKKYRGDTLNTFNTLFGRKDEYNRYRGLIKFSNSSTLFSKVQEFEKTWQKIGNFMLMPNIENNNINKTINTYRGTCSWRDYFDKFLLELDKCFNNDLNKDPILTRFVELNDFYFSNINYDITKFCRLNFLEPYFDEKGSINNFFKQCYYHWQYKTQITEEQKNDYILFSKFYIDKTTEIINYRSEIFVKILTKTLGENENV